MNKEKLNQIKKSIKQKQEELKKLSQDEFKNGTKELFEENPALESFGFKGYVPYFNDGGECVFRANTDEPDINGEDGYDIPYSDEFKHLEPIQEKVQEFLSCFDDDFYQGLFGSHFEVSITKDKIKVSEYTDHD